MFEGLPSQFVPIGIVNYDTCLTEKHFSSFFQTSNSEKICIFLDAQILM